jgi:TatA/E family protein of Tat protein translocase
MPLPSGFEWIVILVIALLILGPGKLPDVASAVGKSIREFRKASSDVQESVRLDAPSATQSGTAPPPPANAPAEVPPATPASPPPPSAAPSPAEPTSNPNR